jgi:hypothetical protein
MFKLNKREKAVIGTLVSMGYSCSVRGGGDGWWIDDQQFDTWDLFWDYALSLLPECEYS